MAETIVDGRGSGNNVGVDSANRLMTTGSITSIPSISTTEASVAKDGTETLGSSTIVGGEWNGSVFPIRIDNGSYVMTAGSIVTMPTVGISGIEDIGSVVIKSAPY